METEFVWSCFKAGRAPKPGPWLLQPTAKPLPRCLTHGYFQGGTRVARSPTPIRSGPPPSTLPQPSKLQTLKTKETQKSDNKNGDFKITGNEKLIILC